MRGDVLARPSPAVIARRLDALGHDHGLTGAQQRDAAANLDLALVRIPYPSTLPPPVLDRQGLDHRVSVLGFPVRQLPVAGIGGAVESLDTRGEHLVVSAGVTAVYPPSDLPPVRRFSVLFNAPWAGHGNSGGALLTTVATTPDGGVANGGRELLRGLVYAGFPRRGGRRGSVRAVDADAIEAYIRAAGLDTSRYGAGLVALAPAGAALAAALGGSGWVVGWAAAGLGAVWVVATIAHRFTTARPRAPPWAPGFAAQQRSVTAVPGTAVPGGVRAIVARVAVVGRGLGRAWGRALGRVARRGGAAVDRAVGAARAVGPGSAHRMRGGAMQSAGQFAVRTATMARRTARIAAHIAARLAVITGIAAVLLVTAPAPAWAAAWLSQPATPTAARPVTPVADPRNPRVPAEAARAPPAHLRLRVVRVLPGLTLDELAAGTDTSVRRWEKANPHIIDPDRIEVGQQLQVPAGVEAWIVQPGDTLSQIAAPVAGPWQLGGPGPRRPCGVDQPQLEPDLPRPAVPAAPRPDPAPPTRSPHRSPRPTPPAAPPPPTARTTRAGPVNPTGAPTTRAGPPAGRVPHRWGSTRGGGGCWPWAAAVWWWVHSGCGAPSACGTTATAYRPGSDRRGEP